jgi:hypothetical protein
MAGIVLSNGMVVQVDSEDLERLSAWKWQASPSNQYRKHSPGSQAKWYACRWETAGYKIKDGKRKRVRKKIYMHRFLMHAPYDMVVDHLNGDGLDNRKENLRVCTQEQNSQPKGDIW